MAFSADYRILDIAAERFDIGVRHGVMLDWCPRFPGLHAFYPSRRHASRALALVIDAMRHR